MPQRKSFREIWPVIASRVGSLNELRMSLVRERRRWRIEAYVGLLTIIGVAVVLAKAGWELLAFAVIAIGLFFVKNRIYRSLAVSRRYAQAFKREIITPLAAEFGFRFDLSQSVSKGTYFASEFFSHRLARFEGEDLLVGQVGDCSVQISEIDADAKSGRKGRSLNVFRGLFLAAEVPWHFSGKTFVRPDKLWGTSTTMTHHWSSGLLGKLWSQERDLADQFLKMPDAGLEKVFMVHSTDHDETRAILSPAMMRRMVALREKFQSKLDDSHEFWFAFLDNNVFIAIERRGRWQDAPHFEPKLAVEITTLEQLERFYDELLLCLDLVDDIALNSPKWRQRLTAATSA